MVETEARYKPNVEIASDAEALAYRSVQVFVADAQKAIHARGSFRVAISGGHTPKRFFELLGEALEAKSLPWDKIELFWVDERYVPPDSEWSNYKLAAETFIGKVGIPEFNVHRIPTEFGDFELAARSYEQTIRRVFNTSADELPEFDLVVLGMGIDGHTGSLFPGITLTNPVLRAARHIAVLICGEEKAQILNKVFTTEPDDVRYPIHLLWPVLDRVTWLVDRDAAGDV